MAKSLRARCNKPHKAYKRNDPKSAFAIADAARLERLHARLVAKLDEPIVRPTNPTSGEDEEEMDVEAEGERMWFAILGLIDQDELHVSPDGCLGALGKALQTVATKDESPAIDSLNDCVQEQFPPLPCLSPRCLRK